MLHQYGLAQLQYLGLTASCEALVLDRYEHSAPDCISTLINGPNINAAVREICDVSRINHTEGVPPPQRTAGAGGGDELGRTPPANACRPCPTTTCPSRLPQH